MQTNYDNKEQDGTFCASNWLCYAFGEIAVKSKPKAYLFKLLEFNKLEINENDGFLAQNTELENLLVKFMSHQNPKHSEDSNNEEIENG